MDLESACPVYRLTNSFSRLALVPSLSVHTDADEYGKRSIIEGNYPGVENAVNHGAYLEALLDTAILYNRIEIVSYLIDCGAKVYVDHFNYSMTMSLRTFLQDAYRHQR